MRYTFIPQLLNRDRLAQDFDSGSPLILLGRHFRRGHNDAEFRAFASRLRRLTYGQNIVVGGPRVLTDSGWGCVVRCTQMLVLNLLTTRLHAQHPHGLDALFVDNGRGPFSVNNLLHIAEIHFGVQLGDYWNFKTGLLCVQLAMARDRPRQTAAADFRIVLFDDCLLRRADVLSPRADGEPLRVLCCFLLMVRDEGDRARTLEFCFGSQFFAGLLGGRGERAYYFFGKGGRELHCIDPHQIKVR